MFCPMLRQTTAIPGLDSGAEEEKGKVEASVAAACCLDCKKKGNTYLTQPIFRRHSRWTSALHDLSLAADRYLLVFYDFVSSTTSCFCLFSQIFIKDKKELDMGQNNYNKPISCSSCLMVRTSACIFPPLCYAPFHFPFFHIHPLSLFPCSRSDSPSNFIPYQTYEQNYPSTANTISYPPILNVWLRNLWSLIMRTLKFQYAIHHEIVSWPVYDQILLVRMLFNHPIWLSINIWSFLRNWNELVIAPLAWEKHVIMMDTIKQCGIAHLIIVGMIIRYNTSTTCSYCSFLPSLTCSLICLHSHPLSPHRAWDNRWYDYQVQHVHH